MSKELIFSGDAITLEEMMDAREQRSFRHLSLLSSNPEFNLLSVTMNIPGEVKTSPILQDIFEDFIGDIKRQLSGVDTKVEHYLSLKTGNEYYLVTDMGAQHLKEKMIDLESHHPLGRLFDLDVLSLMDGHLQAISRQDIGLPARTCFVCSDNAKACGRSRKHSIEEMQAVISQLIDDTYKTAKEE